MSTGSPSVIKRIAHFMGWTRASYYLLSAFLLTVFLIAYIWWPLAEDALTYVDWNGPWWLYFDWLLVGIFLVMSLLIMAGADLKADAWIIFVGLIGGLVIEGWGTQTEIWWYYTAERPPMWIIPAWPIASLSIDRIVRVLLKIALRSDVPERPGDGRVQGPVERSPLLIYRLLYWIMFPVFYALMLSFIWPTMDKSLTIMAFILVTFLVLNPTDHRLAVLTFIAGSGMGYFLEYWGTTRECWTYYTLEKPPLFAVLAHGMAAVAFWRTVLVLKVFAVRIFWFRKGKTKLRPR
jgi:hypothetical protein